MTWRIGKILGFLLAVTALNALAYACGLTPWQAFVVITAAMVVGVFYGAPR